MNTRLLFSTLLVALLLALPATAQQDFSNVEIETVPITDNLFMLVGAGGNIGLSVGEDGAFLVDDQFAPLSEKIQAAVAEQTDQPVRFVVNTHWHGDHTGGNEEFGKAGAVIVAHENVRERMSTGMFVESIDRETPPAPEDALPVVTFTDEVTFHWNDEEIRVMYMDPGHTDGDAVIHFVGANAFHMGDTYFNGRYPYIDLHSGGSLDGVISTANRVLELTDENSQIIPGHGALSNRAELETYRDVLVEARERFSALIEEGQTREEVIAAKPMSDYDEEWGAGFMAPDVWAGIIYDSITGTTP